MSTNCKGLPFFASGVVVKGFGRGSKSLGIPTANFGDDVVEKLPKDLGCGIYHGLASVNSGPVCKMVMSIGWNPYYKNEKKSMETHIMHKFENDFYGARLNVAILGFIRPEKDFNSLDELISAIHADIKFADSAVDQPQWSVYKKHPFFEANQPLHSI